MAKIVYVNVTLDAKGPAAGAVRAGSVTSEDEEGTIRDHQDLIDNTEYPSAQELAAAVAKKLGVSESAVEIG